MIQVENRFVLFNDWKDIHYIIVLNVVSATYKILWNGPSLLYKVPSLVISVKDTFTLLSAT